MTNIQPGVKPWRPGAFAGAMARRGLTAKQLRTALGGYLEPWELPSMSQLFRWRETSKWGPRNPHVVSALARVLRCAKRSFYV